MNTQRTQQIFAETYTDLARKTDFIFAGLFFFQWLLGVGLAFWLSPTAWEGMTPSPHPHLFLAIFAGGLCAAYPIFLIWRNPGAPINQYAVAVAQILYSSLFIHLTDGRIETHFHIFGSLAFLAFYRNPGPILLATAITGIDHLLRGYFWPQSVYGVLTATPWRAFEHTAWVIFEDFFLLLSIRTGRAQMWELATQQTNLEETLCNVEKLVDQRTKALRESQVTITAQQATLTANAKMSALGEMAGGIAHEINTPLAVIQLRTDQLMEAMVHGELDKALAQEALVSVQDTIRRIAKIIHGLKTFARDGKKDPMSVHSLRSIVEDSFSLCREKFANHSVELKLVATEDLYINCRPSEISQVILNLLSNSFDAIENKSEKWIHLEITRIDGLVELSVVDCGHGIPQEIREKIMEPFFTTKDLGKGTGLGLSISKGIVESHGGRLTVDAASDNTRLTVWLPIALPPAQIQSVA